MLAPLLKTKITVPPIRGETIERSNLYRLLDEFANDKYPLLLLSAKAGAGKSSLVNHWLRHSSRKAAWLSLDENDNDPERFIRYTIAALQRAGWIENLDISAAIEAASAPDPVSIAALVLDACHDEKEQIILVLDDFHTLEHEWVHEFTRTFIEGLSPSGGLLLITRIDPPLPLARWRGRSQMLEIRDTDLRFRPDEIDRYLNEAMRLDLSSAQLEILGERTEGWIAGLQLAAITMQNRNREGSLEEFIEDFGGTNRYILDFLLEEVLSQKPPSLQKFLLETSVLDRFSADLCDAVLSQEGDIALAEGAGLAQKSHELRSSKEILQRLENENMFLIPLDDERLWYRYHQLFSDLLRNELKQKLSQDEIQSLHKRASRWFRDNHFAEEAMSHAIKAGDYETAASIIEGDIVNLLSHSTMPRLLRWIRALPDEVVRARPWIAVYLANTLAFSGQISGIEKILEAVDGLPADEPEAKGLLGYAAAIRAYAANLEGDPDRALEMAAQSEELLADDLLNARAMACYALADTHFALDNMVLAADAFQEMLHLGERSGQLLLIVTALCELASISKVRGQLHEAQDLYANAWDRLVDLNGLGTRMRSHYEFGLADLLYEWNHIDQANEHVLRGMDIRARLGGYYVTGDIPLMRIHQARAETGQALKALHDVEQVLASAHVQLSGVQALKTAGVHQYLAVGDMERAQQYADECLGSSELEVIARARLSFVEGRFGETLKLIDSQLGEAVKGNRTARVITMLCLQALAYEGLNKQDEADAATLEAVKLASPEGFVRTILDLGPQVEPLIRRVFDPAGTPGSAILPIDQLLMAYAGNLLAAFAEERKLAQGAPAKRGGQTPLSGYVDPLTPRELEVLSLLSEGLTNKAMASRLVVAPSTIKQHLKNIYAKLDVHSRTEAVARARNLNLIA